MGVVKSVGCRRSESIGVCKELPYDEVFIEPCEGELENSECAVFDEDVGIGRGAEVAVVVEGTIELPVGVTDVGVLWRAVMEVVAVFVVVVVVELGAAAVMEDGFVAETKEWAGLRLALASQLGWVLEPELRAAAEEIGEQEDVAGADDDIVVSGPAART